MRKSTVTFASCSIMRKETRRAVYDYVVYMHADDHDPLSSLLFLYALSPLRSTANAILEAARRASFH